MTKATSFTIGLIRDTIAECCGKMAAWKRSLGEAVSAAIDAPSERDIVTAAVARLGGRVEWDVCPRETIGRISQLIDGDQLEQARNELAAAKRVAPNDPELVRLDTMLCFLVANFGNDAI